MKARPQWACFLCAHCGDPFEQAASAIGIVRPYLQPSDLIAILGKHAEATPRSNVCCLARLEELPAEGQ